MLKIKDNVDLKELEKFGFKLNGRNMYEKYLYDDEMGGYIPYRLCVAGLLKSLFYEDDAYNSNDDLDTIYDLIKADLVEKVDDK